ncbi:MAG: hypothetical protein MUF35_09400 [Candidatus Nanopelagicales bacterium]|jgi:hypothetical protein|nr:hypothetical protein [Candidatus Nanopelagicales bacterium]
MSQTRQDLPTVPLAEALEALVARGTISQAQRSAILAEVGPEQRALLPAAAPGAVPGTTAAAPPAVAPQRAPRRRVADVLIEVGLYVGSALVLAAAAVLVAQRWEDLTETTQIALLGALALVTAVVGSALARGAADGSARRRLAGVVLSITAVSAAGAVGLAMGDSEGSGLVSLAVAVAVMVAAQLLARSAITEVGLFVAAFALLNTFGEFLRPETQPTFDAFGNEVYETTTFDRLMPLGSVVFGVAWALLLARRLMHRELALVLGLGVAVIPAVTLAGDADARPIGLVVLAALAALGFWRFMAEGLWPWLAAAVASVTGFVFWLVGGDQQPALAILVAGLVLLGSSAMGWQVARRRRHALAPPGAPPAGGAPAPPPSA